MTIQKFEQFDMHSLSFDKIKESRETVLVPKVENNSNSNKCALFQLPMLKTFGVPPKNKYFQNESDRQFIQVVLEGEVLEKFKHLDEILGSDAMQVELFGNPTFEYAPIVKQSNNRHLMKLKLMTDDATKTITTKTVENETVLETPDVDSFSQAVPFNSSVKTIIKFVKVWKINKRYGATFKLLKVAVEPHTKQKLDLSHIDFID